MKTILVEEFKKRPQVKEASEPKIRGPFDALVRMIDGRIVLEIA